MARNEARAAFGDDRVYVESFLDQPAPHRDPGDRRRQGPRRPSGRARLLAAAAPPEGGRGSPLAGDRRRRSASGWARWWSEALRKLGYRSLGTVEFLYEDGEFYFIEMNTRLQVEHPVTELITGIDLVREQIRIAAGEPLSFTQKDVRFTGPRDRGAGSTPRTRARCCPRRARCAPSMPRADPGVRMDSALYAGYTVPPFYDSLIAKLIVHDVDRARLHPPAGALPGGGRDRRHPLQRAAAAGDLRHRRCARGRVRHRAGSAASWPAGASEQPDAARGSGSSGS